MKIYIFLAILSIAVAQIAGLDFETAAGRCPKPKTVTNFDPDRFTGIWYDIKRYKNTQLKGSCGTANNTWEAETSTLRMAYEMLEYPTHTLTLLPKDVPNGKFHTLPENFPISLPFWVLDTDYDNYQVVWTCVELVPLVLNTQSLNILSRNTTLGGAYLGPILKNLQSNKLDISILEDVQQDDFACGRN